MIYGPNIAEIFAELVAIEIWDDVFNESVFPSMIEQMAYRARRVRKQEIWQQLVLRLQRRRAFAAQAPKLDA